MASINPARMDMVLRLRSKGISDRGVLGAMEQIRRELFCDPRDFDRAYAEQALPIACGQMLTEPFLLAVMAQSAEIAPDHKVLIIGAGSGYLTAIAAKCARKVYAIDRYLTLCVAAKRQLDELELTNVALMHEDGLAGWASAAPFDAIIVSAGIDAVPEALTAQLADKGRLVCVLMGMLSLVTKDMTGAMSIRKIFAANLTPMEQGKSRSL